jgi:hypothetical protein
MLLKIGLLLLAVWVAGVVGLFSAGDAVHAFLLSGLMLLLLAFARARDAAVRSARTAEAGQAASSPSRAEPDVARAKESTAARGA